MLSRLNCTTLDTLLYTLTPRRSRTNLITFAACALILFLTTCCHYKEKQNKSLNRIRRLKWYVYEDESEPHYAERIIIPAKKIHPSVANITTVPPTDAHDELNNDENHEFLPPLYIDHAWASDNLEFTAESLRFLALIQTVTADEQLHALCPNTIEIEQSVCCLSPSLENGIIYSFNLDQNADVILERHLAQRTAVKEIVIFNPNYEEEQFYARLRDESARELQHSRQLRETLPGTITEEEQEDAEYELKNNLKRFRFFKIAIDVQTSQNKNRRWRRQTLTDIRSQTGHRQINLIRMNLKSSEWKVLKHWLETGEVAIIDQLIVKVHLHWSGFGVNGKDNEIVHQWYNTISSIIRSGLHLVSSAAVTDGPKTFLSKTDLFNTSCCYHLTFFRK